MLKGGKQEALDVIAASLKRLFPGINIAGYYAPAFDFDFYKEPEENERIIKLVREARPDILIAGLGVPKQEKWIYHNRAALNFTPVCIAAGGAFDVAAGNLKRPLEFMRKIGFEWFFRLCREPRRLWKRYLIGNAVFLYLAFKEMIIDKTRPRQ